MQLLQHVHRLCYDKEFELNRHHEQFLKVFPHGFARIPTSAMELMCCLYAIAGSCAEEMPNDVAKPTVNELKILIKSQGYKSIMNIHDDSQSTKNINNLSADQGASLLWLWGQDNYMNLRLGVCSKDHGIEVYMDVAVHYEPPGGTKYRL